VNRRTARARSNETLQQDPNGSRSAYASDRYGITFTEPASDPPSRGVNFTAPHQVHRARTPSSGLYGTRGSPRAHNSHYGVPPDCPVLSL
jgi:hypothetical protein